MNEEKNQQILKIKIVNEKKLEEEISEKIEKKEEILIKEKNEEISIKEKKIKNEEEENLSEKNSIILSKEKKYFKEDFEIEEKENYYSKIIKNYRKKKINQKIFGNLLEIFVINSDLTENYLQNFKKFKMKIFFQKLKLFKKNTISFSDEENFDFQQNDMVLLFRKIMLCTKVFKGLKLLKDFKN